MQEEMVRSYGRADEILVGVFAGIHEDTNNQTSYYFEDFSSFNKETLTWSSRVEVIVEVRASFLKPEIIRRAEFKRLIPLDRVGICWDFYQGKRSVFLVEGQRNLVFLEAGLDETENSAYRELVDAYPVTQECRAVDVFNLMIRDIAVTLPPQRPVLRPSLEREPFRWGPWKSGGGTIDWVRGLSFPAWLF